MCLSLMLEPLGGEAKLLCGDASGGGNKGLRLGVCGGGGWDKGGTADLSIIGLLLTC